MNKLMRLTQLVDAFVKNISPKAALITAMLCMVGCSGNSDENSGGNSDSDNASESGSHVDNTETWLINSTALRSGFIFDAMSNQGELTNVQTVLNETNNGIEYLRVVTEGIPDYQVTLTQTLFNQLNSRTEATTDFVNGSTNASIGDVIEFGQDIGFNRSPENCGVTGGSGFWPPSSGCPLGLDKSNIFRTSPQPGIEQCDTARGAIGYFSNGSSIYGWNNGQSYQDAGIWQYSSPETEIADFDICMGHATNGEYHHHSWTACLAAQLNDNGDQHSPVYGRAADGYLIYGPWYSAGTLVSSAWVKRDYDTPDSITGCDAPGARNCLLVDQYDISKGTTLASSNGPRTDDTISITNADINPGTNSAGNSMRAIAGLFNQDYYYDAQLTALGGRYLDQHNGHAHDGSDYHYHLTVSEIASGTLSPDFPYSVGPSYYGLLDDNSLARCAGAIASVR